MKIKRADIRRGMLGLSIVAALGFSGFASGYSVDGNEITLRMGSGHPPVIKYVEELSKYFAPNVQKRVAAETKYKIKFQEHYAGTVVNVFDTLEGVQDGRLDIGGWCVCFDDDKAMAMNLPYYTPFSPPDGNVAIKVFRKLVDTHPELYQDYEKRYNQKLIALSGFSNYGMMTKFDWSRFEDLKGRKILAAGPNLPWVKGAIPVRTTIPTIAQQMQTGVGEGIVLFPDTLFKLKIHESAKYYTTVDFGAVVQISLTMNSGTRAKLPPEVVKIIDEEARKYETHSMAASMADYDWGIAQLEKAGVTIKSIDRATAKAWALALKDWPNERAQNVKQKKGIDMPGIMRDYIRLIEETGYRFPVSYEIR
ncbi:MAG: TRAP transporter substrate-binding protein DctP [Burkholderiales bacterium]|nr:TRAP transporter substrate-binding protein DctP [Burkholderiales bacterium]